MGRRVLWMCLFVTMTCLVTYQSVLIIAKFLEKPVKYEVSMKMRDKPIFPAVTLCNKNAFHKGNLKEVNQSIYNAIMSPLQHGRLDYNLTNPLLLRDELTNRDFVQSQLKYAIGDVLGGAGELNLAAGHFPHQKFIVSCTYDHRPCSRVKGAEEHRIAFYTDYGVCYTVNWNGTLDSTYTGTEAFKHRPRMELLLYLDTDNYLNGLTSSEGARLVIHEPRVVPFPEDHGIDVKAGVQTEVGITESYLNLHYDPPEHNCKREDVTDSTVEASTRSYTSEEPGVKYSTEICVRGCTHEGLIRECGCYSTRMHVTKDMRNNTTHGPCETVTLTQGGGLTMDINECMLEFANAWDVQKSCGHCVKACKSASYEESISQSVWPAKSYHEAVAKSLTDSLMSSNLTSSLLSTINLNDLAYIRQNFVYIKIYSKSMMVINTSQKSDYSKEGLIGDIGGLLGFYIGCSMLTIAEILELGFDLLLCYTVNSKVGRDKSDVEEQQPENIKSESE